LARTIKNEFTFVLRYLDYIFVEFKLARLVRGDEGRESELDVGEKKGYS